MDPSDAPNGDGTNEAIDRPIPEFVDWLAAAVFAITGLALAAGGSALTFVVDRELIDRGIESGEITVIVVERELTRPEAIEFTLAVVTWTGIGLLVTGIASVLFAIVYVFIRHRVHARIAPGESAGSSRANAVLGAAATMVLSFVPFSPILGGGLAGYLERGGPRRSVGVGAVSGLLAVFPGISIPAFAAVGLSAGLADVGQPGLGVVVGVLVVFVLLFVAAYGAGGGALGGFVGGRFADSRS